MASPAISGSAGCSSGVNTTPRASRLRKMNSGRKWWTRSEYACRASRTSVQLEHWPSVRTQPPSHGLRSLQPQMRQSRSRGTVASRSHEPIDDELQIAIAILVEVDHFLDQLGELFGVVVVARTQHRVEAT
jgi:hypothetical protein